MSQSLQPALLKVSRLHFAYAAALAAQVIIYDAWQLLAPTAVLQRWAATALFICAITGVWYFAHPGRAERAYHRLTFLLIVADIALASFAVYNQRGMASRAVALYAIPIIVAAILKKRAAIFAVAILCMAAYVSAAISYFVLHFNEGYKIELYGEVGFYAVMFLLLAGLVASLSVPKRT